MDLNDYKQVGNKLDRASEETIKLWLDEISHFPTIVTTENLSQLIKASSKLKSWKKK